MSKDVISLIMKEYFIGKFKVDSCNINKFLVKL